MKRTLFHSVRGHHILGLLIVVPLLSAASGQSLPTLFEPAGGAPPDRIIWATEPGVRYDLWESGDLDDWTRVAGYPAQATGLAMEQTFSPEPRKFFRIDPIDEQPPAVTARFPDDGDFAIGRFSTLSIGLADTTGIDPGTIRLTVGGRGTFQPNGAELSFADGVITFDGGGDTALGTHGEVIGIILEVADTLGNSGVYAWSFQLEAQTQLASGLFVFGSPDALRAGQRVGAIATRALIKGPLRMDDPVDPWTLETVEADRIVLAYTGALAPIFAVDTLICNRTPASLNEIFYRRITSVNDDPALKKLNLVTEDVGLEEIVIDGTLSTGADSLAFEVGTDGVIQRAIAIGGNIPLGNIGYSADDTTFELTRHDGVKIVTVDFETLHWWLRDCRFRTSVDVGLFDGLRRLDAVFEANLDSALVFDASVALAGEAWKKTFDLYPFAGPVLLIPLGTVGFVSISFDLKLEGKAEAAAVMNIHAGFRQEGRIGGLGFRYLNPDFSWVNSFNLSSPRLEPFTGNVNGNFSLGLDLVPSVSFLVYGLAGAEIGLKAGGKLVLEGNSQNALGGRFEAGLDLSLSPVGPALEWLRPQPSLKQTLWERSWQLVPDEGSLEIRSQPKDVTASVGGPAGFDCAANRSAGVSWQWYHGGLAIPGETRPHLDFPSVAVHHEGLYSVRATAAGVTVQSSAANLKVLNNYGDLAEYFQYPMGDRAWKPEFPNHPSVAERNDLYPENPAGDILARADKVASGGWYNIQDVGSYNSALTIPGIHPGEDWNKVGGDIGESIFPISKGKVVKVSPTNSSITQWGWTVVVEHLLHPNLRKPNDAEVYYSVYAHLSPRADGSLIGSAGDESQFPYQVGASVAMHRPLGYVASISAPHLHLELRRKVREISDLSPLYVSPSPNGYYPISNGVASAFSAMRSEGYEDPSDFIDDHGAISNDPATDGFSLIPAGRFQMGDTMGDTTGTPTELPVHSVHVSAFYMGRYEVTKAVWDEVRRWGLGHGYSDLPSGGGKAANHPVHSINWYSMVKWCNARSEKEGLLPCYTVSDEVYRTGEDDAIECDWSANGYRLPTEAEWEKAARGGLAGKRFPWGDTITHSQANYYSSSNNFYDTSVTRGNHPAYNQTGIPYTAPVGSFAPNGFGLYDMAGNMWEWCWDWFSGTYYATSPGSDPRGPDSGTGRMLRGGHWVFGANYCRASGIREGYAPTFIHGALGFRLARSSVP